MEVVGKMVAVLVVGIGNLCIEHRKEMESKFGQIG